MESNKPNASVWRYLRAFTYDSLAKMSGPLSVPFVALTLYVSSPTQRVLFGVLAIVSVCTASYRVWRLERSSSFERELKLKEEVAALAGDKERLEVEIAALRDNTAAKRQQLVANLISELGRNCETAAHPTSGLPGIQCYIPPSTECSNSSRNELFFLDGGILKELGEVYAKVERWKGIVVSGINPMLGSLEIPEITAGLSSRLPGLIEKLKHAGRRSFETSMQRQ
jgi:hypothetical protein